MQHNPILTSDCYVPDKTERYGSGPEDDVEERYDAAPASRNESQPNLANVCAAAHKCAEDLATLRDDEMLERMVLQTDREDLLAENQALRAKLDAVSQSLLAICAYYSQAYRPRGSDIAELTAELYARGYIFVPDPSIERMREKRTP